jgi:hypothetical protein
MSAKTCNYSPEADSGLLQAFLEAYNLTKLFVELLKKTFDEWQVI